MPSAKRKDTIIDRSQIMDVSSFVEWKIGLCPVTTPINILVRFVVLYLLPPALFLEMM